MATDVERLVVAMEARTAAFEKALQKANGTANRQARAIEKRFQSMNDNISRSFQNMLRAGAAIGGIGIGVSEIQKMADTWTDLSSRVGLAVGDMDKAPQVMERIYDMAQRTYSGLENTAESFLTNAGALKELGYNTNQQLDFTEALNNALVVSGAKADRASRVIDALGKSMASGKLQGDNLNTVIEVGGRVSEVLAAQLGIGVNQLRKAGKEGKITGDVIYKALTTRLKELTAEAESMPATISDGFQKVANGLLKFVGTMDQASGVSATIAQGLVFVGDNFNHVAIAAAAAAAVLLGQYVPAMARVALAGAAMVATNPFLLLAAGIGAATFAISAFGDQIQPIAGEMANLQDYAAVAWEGIKIGATDAAEVTRDAMLSVINFISKMMDDSKAEWSDVGSFITNELDGVIAAFKGLVAETKVIFNELPAAIAEYVIDAMNTMIAGIESGLQKALNGINAVSKALNGVDKFLGFTPLLNENLSVDLGRIENTYKGAGKVAADAWNEALETGRKRYFSEYLQDVRDKANARASQRTADAKSDNLLIPSSNAGGGGKAVAADSDGKKKKARKERQNELQREIQQIKERTATLQAETAAQAQINPLIDDYDYAITKAKATQELLNAAKKAGIEITPALKEQINGLAEGYAHATAEANKLAESQEQAREAADFFKNSMLDAFQSMVPTIETGNKALDKFLNTLIEAVIQATLLGKGPLAGLFGGGGLFKGGGLLGGAIIPGILHSGGVAGSDGYGHGRAVSPSAFSGAKRYHRGGIAGLQPGEIPAILQRGEVVLPRNSKIGGGSTETINVVLRDDSGRMAQIADQRIQTASGAIVQVSVQQSAKAVQSNFPTMLADAQARKM